MTVNEGDLWAIYLGGMTKRANAFVMQTFSNFVPCQTTIMARPLIVRHKKDSCEGTFNKYSALLRNFVVSSTRRVHQGAGAVGGGHGRGLRQGAVQILRDQNTHFLENLLRHYFKTSIYGMPVHKDLYRQTKTTQ